MGNTMFALCWADRRLKSIISNWGITLPGSEVYEKRIQCPQMIELFFSAFSTIDVHDHLRPGSLALKREWATHSGALRRDGALGSGIADFNTFVDRLAYQLIHNNYATSRVTQKRVGSSKRVQRLCSVCRRKASFFCDDCSTPSKNVLCTLCGPGTGQECYKTHLEAGAAV
ncbi:TPA: hypothetical protein N0F65_012927 [Lagenidium giganteum]|uniref:PiggyBac transposable element-derived protein domain-containing protein n=1 Tax=Lagenidium giganteum TaxID=4803 RepID=A0AAV2Z1X3_9STRA|nr:TPA: hypothetical protein N0F65_012927 [Lagenidium giganteum]